MCSPLVNPKNKKMSLKHFYILAQSCFFSENGYNFIEYIFQGCFINAFSEKFSFTTPDNGGFQKKDLFFNHVTRSVFNCKRIECDEIYARFSNSYNKRFIWVLSLFFVCIINLPHVSSAFPLKERRSLQYSIVDYRLRLNPGYKKVRRKKTKYIIVHTSELGLKMTLRVVSRGKRLRNGRRTYGGHANYVIARNGRTYRVLNKKYVADHAGLSMWNGETDISKISIGILELVGYHYAPITESQSIVPWAY